jgi:protein-tyrosine phosphatase
MTVQAPSRDLDLEVAHNVRHLGGYAAGGGETSATIIRAASLHRLTGAGVEALAATGVTTVIDLRSSVERTELPTPPLWPWGVHTIHAPVFERDASPAGLRDFGGYRAVYHEFLETGRPAYRTLFETLARAHGGVLFHCAAGKDRTGVAAALLLDLAGVPHETIVGDYARSATLLEPAFAQWLPKMRERGIDETRARALMASKPEDMEATLRHLRERWGSAEGYLASTGMSPAAIGEARARVLA